MKNASLQAQEQKETLAILKQKYTAAIEKVYTVQGQVEHLEEELCYSQQQVQYINTLNFHLLQTYFTIFV